MINAQLHSSETHLAVRFSDPNGTFSADTELIPVSSEHEARRMLHFQNRKYITNTLLAWLHQRKHAVPSANQEITNMISWVENMQKCGLGYIRSVVCNRTKDFKSIAPREKSRFYKHYQTTILPILDFCQNRN